MRLAPDPSEKQRCVGEVLTLLHQLHDGATVDHGGVVQLQGLVRHLRDLGATRPNLTLGRDLTLRKIAI